MADHEKQKEFEATVKHVNSSFPKQVNARALLTRYDECQKYIEQAWELAKTFQEHSKDHHPLQTLPELGELLKNCVWYLHELGRHGDALELLDIAYESVPDKESALYAYLCNSAAVTYFELNDLKPCLEFNEKGLQIREIILAPDDLDLLSSYHNLGNLASAQGRYDDALEYFAKTENVPVQAGPEAVESLGLTHMMTGRVFFLRKQYTEALERYDMAEENFKLSPGPSSQLMAHLILALGNLKYAQDSVDSAKELYEKGHKLSHDLGPAHVLTATFDYKLGLVEARLENYEKAMDRLQKALVVLEGQNAKGDIARVLRKQALVIMNNPASTSAQSKEANALMERAEAIRAELSDVAQQDASLPVDLVYDNMVCGHFR